MVTQPDRISSYFKQQKGVLAIVTAGGLIYNVGLAVGPWLEGQLVQCLADIINGLQGTDAMVRLACIYLAVTLLVQGMRAFKRFFVRRFANNVNRNMKGILYANLVRMPCAQMEREDTGALMTKAVSDVDACAEGMRKFTTEVFDTGVALVSYVCLLVALDWRLALLSCIFPPVALVFANCMKHVVQRNTAAFKQEAGHLNAATLNRVEGMLVYRIFGCEAAQDAAYEQHLSRYEQAAVRANIWVAALQPLYQIAALVGMVFIVGFGVCNVLGTGWATWDLAAFTAFIACFARLALKASKTAKLFNSVQQAQVSWRRIKPLLHAFDAKNPASKTATLASASVFDESPALELSQVNFSYPDVPFVLQDLTLSAHTGQIIGVTGAVASGKSTLGKLLLCEYPYEGSITFDGQEFARLDDVYRASLVAYQGHDSELLSDTIADNILLGSRAPLDDLLRATCLADEVAAMEDGVQTVIGSGGVRLSGGQQARVALARTLAHPRPIIVLDDPFAAVDKQTEAALFANVRKAAQGSIVLLISHRLWLFPQLDQIVWMQEGRATVGTHEELLVHVPAYAQLYHAQVEGGDISDEE